ncbi:MAG TPA: right-handed parallel beta-helix repeat-containing protein, partial [Opitutaceae bacterium]|nr:right-handed parallel beta-helix repeat-containing protein [Opitutaceae bacterium]
VTAPPGEGPGEFGRARGPMFPLPEAARTAIAAQKPGPFGYPGRDTLPAGVGNKSIALKNCRNVIFRDFTIYHGGHFAILATGVDNWTCDNLKIDTNRDGIDFDCCQNVRVSNCTVNSPFDDGICPKSSFALGYNRPTMNVTITNCQVSGYEEGSLLAGTYKRTGERGQPTGRIKCGTEANGGFKNITISNCVFEYCRGLALEEVDGGWMEDITVTNLTMREIVNAPIFIRLSARLRGPNNPPVGVARRIKISNVVATDVAPDHGILIVGIPGHTIDDVSLSNILIEYRGGGTREQAAREVPEYEKEYPEPSRFGTIPAYGMFARHVKGLTLDHVEVRYAQNDQRPPFFLHDVTDADFDHVKAQHAEDVPSFVLKDVNGFVVLNSPGVPDTRRDQPVDSEEF